MNKTYIIILILAISFSLFACQEVEQKEAPAKEKTEKTPDPYLAKGKEIAGSVFGVLSTELIKSMMANGVAATVTYCNERAYPITDSMAAVHQAHIKRTSHKVRNPENAPNDLEADMLEKYLTLEEKGLEMPAQVVQQGENKHFFAPILMSEACLKCHGMVGETLAKTDLAVIQKLYPTDEATGFSNGEFRGMWSIRF